MHVEAVFGPGWKMMRPLAVALVLGAGVAAVGQTAAPVGPGQVGAVVPDTVAATPMAATTTQAASASAATQSLAANPALAVPPAIQPLLDFQPSDVKFSVADLMDLLRDRRHEGWVLAAYPDPKTGRPLIGAGFSLDLPEREHAQMDPMNPHQFVEPSSAQLWQAAGLEPALLDRVLDQFEGNLATWRTAKRYRHRIWSLDPQITDEQAEALLRIAAIQAIVNARAWCRDFDDLAGPQQMAVSQLVYQMGVNLGEFSTFLALINNEPVRASALAGPGAEEGGTAATIATSAVDVEHWRDVQQSLMQSQWARLYRVRAVAVIAMLDPRYMNDPAGSEARIAAVLRPTRHRRGHVALRTASYRRHAIARKGTARVRARRKA